MRKRLLASVSAPAIAISLVACVGGGADVSNPGDQDDADGGGIPSIDASAPVFDGGSARFDAASFDAGKRDAGSSANGNTFYGACLSELAFQQPDRRFNFFVDVIDNTPPNLLLALSPLAVVNNQPPPTVSKSGIVGATTSTQSTASQAGVFRFVLQQPQMTIPGTANPISGTDVVIENVTLNARWQSTRHCARLGGEITQPVAAARTLDPEQNICLFFPINEGDPTPTLTAADFAAVNCPP